MINPTEMTAAHKAQVLAAADLAAVDYYTERRLNDDLCDRIRDAASTTAEARFAKAFVNFDSNDATYGYGFDGEVWGDANRTIEEAVAGVIAGVLEAVVAALEATR